MLGLFDHVVIGYLTAFFGKCFTSCPGVWSSILSEKQYFVGHFFPPMTWMTPVALQFQLYIIRSHLKKWILVQVRGGAEFKTAGILTYFEDFKRGTNKEVGPKDFFEIAST